jgi:predicted N-acetyltransferase YhbS
MRAPPMTLADALLPPLVAERPEDAARVERLLLRAFGPGRFAKSAERLREGRRPALDLSFVAWEDGQIVGCVQQWMVIVGETPAILLGPFAVDPDFRSQGLGAALIEQACAAAAKAGHGLIILVGDMPYFGKFGFTPAPGAVMPGPVDQRRVLARALKPGAIANPEGAVGAA